MMALNGIVGKADQMMDHIDTWGDPTTFPHFAIGWAWAGNTPFQWTKQVASHFGGTRNGMVMHWPKGIKAKGEVRSQFHHVIDVAPTALEAAKIPHPKTVNGVKQRPMDGVSMLYSTDDAKAADRRTTQYFEMFGNRGIYHEGWVACTRHSIPWLMVQHPAAEGRRVGALQRGRGLQPGEQSRRAESRRSSRSSRRSSSRRPSATTCCRSTIAAPSASTRPSPAGPTCSAGARRSPSIPAWSGMMENAFINVKGVHHTVTAEVELKDDKTNGVIIAQAGYFGGWTLYMKDGKPHHEYNWFALERTNIGGDDGARARQAHDQLRVHPRRRQARHRRQVDPQRRRQESRRSADPQDPALRLLRRRRRGRGPRRRDERVAGLQAERQRLHRQDRQGDRRAEVSVRLCCAFGNRMTCPTSIVATSQLKGIENGQRPTNG